MNLEVVNYWTHIGVREGAQKFLTECLGQPMGDLRVKLVYPTDLPDRWVKDAAYFRWIARKSPMDPSGMDEDTRLAKAELLNTPLGWAFFHILRGKVYVPLVLVSPPLSKGLRTEVYQAFIREFWNMCGSVVCFLPFAQNEILQTTLQRSGFIASDVGWTKYK
ncbi:MAG: hypothetical protein WCV62_05090 [Candidatus Peribacteraceae bacterium]|jgi:hypothetical protein